MKYKKNWDNSGKKCTNLLSRNQEAGGHKIRKSFTLLCCPVKNKT